jgi:hypothetical protein
VLLLDERRRPRRWVPADELAGPDNTWERRGIEVRAVVEPTATLATALEAMLGSVVGVVVVVDRSGAVLGTLDLRTIMSAVEAVRAPAPDEPAPGEPPADEAASR